MNITAAERVILHIAEYWKESKPLDELTQKGIAEGAGLRRGHVPRNLKKLMVEGFIEKSEGRVSGRGRKVKFYKITEAGLRRAKQLKESLLMDEVEFEGEKKTIGELAKRFELSVLTVALNTDDSRVFSLPPIQTQVKTGLIDRDEDIGLMRKWYRESSPVLVIYGATGMGKTALGREFVSKIRGPYVWINVLDGEKIDRLLSELSRKLGLTIDIEMEKEIFEKLRSKEVLMVFDGYNQVTEGVVDFLTDAISELKGSNSKILVLAQATTPSYCRFYSRDSVNKGDVREHHLSGLSMQGCKKMLDVEQIDEEALKRIYLLTKGTPLYLDLIRRGDIEELRQRSRFTNAEIRLLMFSKDTGTHR